MRLPRFARLAALLVVVGLLLTGCFGGERINIFPPRASIQQLTMQADGSWKLQLRLQNFSNVAMTVATTDAKIEIAGNIAGSVSATPNVRIGPESAEPVEANLNPSAAAASAVSVSRAGNLHYKLSGRIVTSDPTGDYPYTFDGELSPVPGLNGIFR
ncbi:MAG: hypothetical protein ABIT64_00095 [Lysobacteraceae bacterium]